MHLRREVGWTQVRQRRGFLGRFVYVFSAVFAAGTHTAARMKARQREEEEEEEGISFIRKPQNLKPFLNQSVVRLSEVLKNLLVFFKQKTICSLEKRK